MLYFEEIINRLKESLKIGTDKQVYELMNVKQATFTNWRTRNKIPFEEINTICVDKNLDINYILNGIKKEQITINYKEEIIKSLETLSNNDIKSVYHFVKSKEN
ncbi:helix-turn-helix domain-containing protein [Halarcobacter sp.]|uniref:helix-turn-helix domain-containing protein n=1 Tax=Halarcobacter sp. TaxID=2321133 RepID=UPI003A8ECB61